jgi:hypothetical protein
MAQGASTTWKDTHADQDGDLVPDQDQETVAKGVTRLPQILMMKVTIMNTMTQNLID